MEFFINKNSTLPYLKMELVNDGRNDFRKFYEKIQNATITDASIELKCETCGIGGDEPEYYIVYKWDARDTRRVGQYNGEFTITFLDGTGTLIAPIRDELFINVLDN